jgi:hypothetical protein
VANKPYEADKAKANEADKAKANDANTTVVANEANEANETIVANEATDAVDADLVMRPTRPMWAKETAKPRAFTESDEKDIN